jgi:hypothetical protein
MFKQSSMEPYINRSNYVYDRLLSVTLELIYSNTRYFAYYFVYFLKLHIYSTTSVEVIIVINILVNALGSTIGTPLVIYTSSIMYLSSCSSLNMSIIMF